MAKNSMLKPADVTLLIGAMKVVFATRDDVREIVKEEIKHLPTKEEFFSRMDTLSGEYKKIDDAETIHTDTIGEHTDTLEKHEERIKALESRRQSTPSSLSSAL